MSILWISKRRYMRKDLLGDRFGRYFEVPLRLAQQGLQIELVLLDYRGNRSAQLMVAPGFSIRSFALPSAAAMLAHVWSAAHSPETTTIIGSSDMPYCILANCLARQAAKRCVCDLYDNFETYASSRIPLMKKTFYRALRQTDRVICFDETLAGHLHEAHGVATVGVVPNGVDTEVFHPLDRRACREALGIPSDIPVIGYFGSLTGHRGAQTLFDAFERIAARLPETLFLLAGGLEKGLTLPAVNLRHLGMLPQRDLPECICASNVCTVTFADNAFSRFSFAQKMMEYVACGVPLAAPNVGGAVAFLAEHPSYLYRAGDSASLADAVLRLLQRHDHRFPPLWTWTQAAERFRQCLLGGAQGQDQ